MALDAKLVLISKGNERTADLADLYTNDGIMPFAMEPQELLKEIIVPTTATASAYQRLAYRSAIDYPIVCAGTAIVASAGLIDEARISVGAMGRSPLYLAQASSLLKGKALTDENAFQEAAVAAMDSAAAFAVDNVGSTLDYRCAMVEKMVFRALKAAADAILCDPTIDGATKK
jgi:CO/xanthine dehydrogenase FAD-binding subunit